MAEPKPETTIAAPTASGGPAGDGLLAVAPAILAPPALPGADLPRDENPVLAYLARLSPGSRRTMRASLETIARLASAGEVGALDFPWWMLRYHHAEAIRGRLAESYAPATANQMLSAMKGVLKSCWRLGLMSADERERASDVEPVRGSRLSRGARSRAGSCAPSSRSAPVRPTVRSSVPGASGTRRCWPCSTWAASGGPSSLP